MQAKTMKGVEEPDNVINQHDLISIYKTLQPIRTEQIFFSSEHRTVPKTGHILDHKKKNSTYLKEKAKQTENHQLFSDLKRSDVTGQTAIPKSEETGKSRDSILASVYLENKPVEP